MTDPLAPAFRFRTARVVALGLVGINLLVIGAAWRTLSQARRDKIEEARRNASNLADVLGENLEGTIHMVDLALVDALGDVAEAAEAGRGLDAALDHHLARLNAQVGFSEGIRIASARGRVEHGSGVPAGAPVDVSDREYFVRARDDANGELVVSSPVTSRITGKRVVVFARRIVDRHGAFHGVVYAPVAVDAMARTLHRVSLGHDGAVVLRSRDNTLIARHPERPDGLPVVGERRITPQLEAVLASRERATTFVAPSPFDGIEKINAFRRVLGDDFYLLVAVPMDASLAAWRADVTRSALGISVFAAMTVLLGLLTVRSWRREAEARFRSLVEGAPVAIVMARRGRVLYVNGAFARTMRLPSGQVAVGRSIFDSMGPEDAAEVAGRWDRLGRHLPVAPTVELSLRRPDGEPFLAAITDAEVELDDGPAILGFVQDVTERRRFDAERERLIGELKAALADVKTLSGLLPICAHCKKVRDDRGYWSRIETYIRERSNAEFTHGICPDCAKQFFPEGGEPPEGTE